MKLPFKNKIFIIVTAAVFVVFVLFLVFGKKEKHRPTKYVAFVGKYTNQKDPEGKPSAANIGVEVALRYYLNQYNQSSNKPYQIKLKEFDNCADGGFSRKLYEDVIGVDSSIFAAIDFTWGAHFKKAAHVVRDLDIPVVTINPDHNNLDFGNNALFMYNDDDTPIDLTAFVKNAAKINRVNFISESDYPLHFEYLKSFDSLDLQIKNLIAFNGEHAKDTHDYDSIYTRIQKIYDDYPKDTSVKLTFLFNTHSQNGDTILKYIDQKMQNVRVVGPVYFAKNTKDGDFGVDNGNEMILINRPADALSKRLLKDLMKLKKERPEIFNSSIGSICIKRAFDAYQIIRKGLEYGDNKTSPSKKNFQAYVHSLRSANVVGEEDLYQFNNEGSMVKELVFSNMIKGKTLSYTMQLNSHREVIPNLFFGMEIQDIFDLDVNTNSFSADFYYWVKVDTADAHVESYISFQNMKQSESTKELVIEEQKDNILYKLYRVSGKFFVEYDLRNYPMDKQEIDIIVEILRPIDDVKISFDKESFVQDSSLLERFKVPGWEKEGYFVTVNNKVTNTMRGDPTHDSGTLNKFKKFYFSLDVKRNWLSGFLEIILPLAMISFISIGLLFTKDISFMTLGEVSVGTFLGIIAFSISLSETTPSTSYLTKADLLFWLSFITNFISFMVVIVLNSRYDEISVKRVNINSVKYPLLIFYPVAVAAILWLY